MPAIEIEVRGELSRAQYDKLLTDLADKATFQQEKYRIFIDYSTFLDDHGIKDRTLDIRARLTNGVPEMIVKVGTWGTDEVREEISVFGTQDQFIPMLELYAALGYTKGILGERHSQVYDYGEIEFAVVEVPGHSYYFEAEIVTDTDHNYEQVRQQLVDTCVEFSLAVFTDEQFFAYIDRLNAESNDVFDCADDGIEKLKEKYGKYLELEKISQK